MLKKYRDMLLSDLLQIQMLTLWHLLKRKNNLYYYLIISVWSLLLDLLASLYNIYLSNFYSFSHFLNFKLHKRVSNSALFRLFYLICVIVIALWQKGSCIQYFPCSNTLQLRETSLFSIIPSIKTDKQKNKKFDT